jgi:C-terminal peptidase prc
MKFSRNSIMGCAAACALMFGMSTSFAADTAAPKQSFSLPSWLTFTSPAANPNVHPVDDYPTKECPQRGQDFATPAKFDGHLLYRCAFQGIMELSYKLKDENDREAWAKVWEHKHDSDGALDTPEGADKAVKEMLDGVGERFNYYFNEKMTKANAQSFNSSFVGIGAELTLTFQKDEKPKGDEEPKIDKDHQIKVVKTFADAPASKVDIKPGDLITAVNGVSLEGLTLSKAIEEKIKGPKDTDVTLTIQRGDASHDVKIHRDVVVQHVVSQHKFVADGVYYVRIEEFNSQFFMNEVRDAFKAGAGAKAYVLDLRRNPGGFLNYATFLSESLIPEGKYLTTIGRDGTSITTDELILEADGVIHRTDDRLQGEQRAALLIPAEAQLVVLIDEGSASASEILAGTLQANHRAIVVGVTSHGKGEVQTEVPLPFSRAERVISAEFRPGGRAMDWVGIVPDVEVKGDIFESEENFKGLGDPTKDAQLQTAIEQVQKLVLSHDESVAKEAAAKKAHEDEFAKQQEFLKKMEQQKLQNNGSGH